MEPYFSSGGGTLHSSFPSDHPRSEPKTNSSASRIPNLASHYPAKEPAFPQSGSSPCCLSTSTGRKQRRKVEGGAGSTGRHGARSPSAPQPSPGTQAEANLTLGKQLAPPRRVLPWHFLELWLTELPGGETRLGRGHGEVGGRAGQSGVSADASRREERSGEHQTWGIPERRAAGEVTESKAEKRKESKGGNSSRREARETGWGQARPRGPQPEPGLGHQPSHPAAPASA